MSSTPKPRDGDASADAGGSLSPLERTVMGLAPAAAAGMQPERAPVPALAEPASLVLPSATIIAVPDIPSPPLAIPNHPAPGSIVAAPTIALSGSEAAASPRPSVDVTATLPAGEVPAADPIDATLRSDAPAPATRASEAVPARTEADGDGAREHTVLSDDYLRAARAAALEQIAERPPTSSPMALASTELAPPVELAATVASGAPSSGDTRRSIASDLEPEPAATRGEDGNGAPAPSVRGFEPVPVLRAQLAESLSNALGPMAELGGSRSLLTAPSRPQPLPPPLPRAREGVGRWLLLAAVALATVGIVSVGGRLWHRYRAHTARQRAVASVDVSAPAAVASSAEDTTSASRALLANRPALDAFVEGRVRVVSATPSVTDGAVGPGASATPESQLAATAARHVLSGNFAEALPVYRQLERGWPQNTAYAAMARLLEKKVGSRNDTRTITPAASTSP